MAKVCIFYGAAESEYERLNVQALRDETGTVTSIALEKPQLLCNPRASCQETGSGRGAPSLVS
jgi:hypothetical protein